jgi:hypothetical protein
VVYIKTTTSTMIPPVVAFTTIYDLDKRAEREEHYPPSTSYTTVYVTSSSTPFHTPRQSGTNTLLTTNLRAKSTGQAYEWLVAEHHFVQEPAQERPEGFPSKYLEQRSEPTTRVEGEATRVVTLTTARSEARPVPTIPRSLPALGTINVRSVP